MRIAAALLVASLVTAAGFAQGEIKYDRFKDVTTLACPSLEGFRIDHVNSLTLAVGVKGDGFTETAAEPDGALIFSSRSRARSWYYLHDHDVDLLIDGEPHSLESVHDGRVGHGGVVEVVQAPLEIETMTKMATAGAVEVRVGRTEIAFDEKMRERLRACLEQIGVALPPPDATSDPK